MLTVSIKGLSFVLRTPYAAGAELKLSAAEAMALNRFRAEEICGVVSKEVLRVVLDSAPPGASVPLREVNLLQAQISELDERYVLGTSAPKPRSAPLEQELCAVVEEALRAELEAEGGARISEWKWLERREALMLKPALQTEARRRLAASQKVAAEAYAAL